VTSFTRLLGHLNESRRKSEGEAKSPESVKRFAQMTLPTRDAIIDVLGSIRCSLSAHAGSLSAELHRRLEIGLEDAHSRVYSSKWQGGSDTEEDEILCEKEILQTLQEWQEIIHAGEEYVLEHPEFLAVIKKMQIWRWVCLSNLTLHKLFTEIDNHGGTSLRLTQSSARNAEAATLNR